MSGHGSAGRPSSGGRIRRILKTVVVRAYALLILAVVVWTGYAAVSYLYRFVFTPAKLPARFTEWAGELEADALWEADRPGVTAPALRAPIARYHSTPRGFRPAPQAGCSTSGCHHPFPHVQSPEVRAFANFHATFTTCRTCHDARIAHPAETHWVDPATGEPRDAPAVLRLMDVMDRQANTIRDDPAGSHDLIVDLLTEAIRVMGGDPVLDHVRVEMETSFPGGPVWRQAVDQLAGELPAHGSGEYGLKIDPVAPAQGWWSDEDLARMRRAYLAALPDSAEAERILERIHEPVLSKPDACLACHGPDEPRFDFEGLGYSRMRSDTLRGSLTVRMIEGIREGRPFYLPRLLEREHP